MYRYKQDGRLKEHLKRQHADQSVEQQQSQNEAKVEASAAISVAGPPSSDAKGFQSRTGSYIYSRSEKEMM